MSLNFQKLFDIVGQLGGENGCIWFKDQSTESFCQYVIEETYEAIDALKEGDTNQAEEELGDVLFALVCALKSAQNRQKINLQYMIDQSIAKIIRRHPHVFEDPRPITFEELRVQWEEIKAKERLGKKEAPQKNLFSSVASSMPVVTKAMKYIELGNSKGFKYEPNEETYQGQFLKMMIEGLNDFQNMDRVFEEALLDYKKQFQAYFDEENFESSNKKPEIDS